MAESRRRLSGDARREAILTAAGQLFAEEGFGGSTREIAKRLGVTQGLLYRYFPSKDALIDAVFEAFRGLRLPTDIGLLNGRSRPLVERLQDFYVSYISGSGDYPGVRLFMFAALAGIDLPLRYGPDLDRHVLGPVIDALRAERNLPAAPRPLPPRERDLAIGLHGAIVFVGIRRHIYRAGIDDDRHKGLVRGIVTAWLPGALDFYK
jgi:AcrR family transcriptional regulator